MVPGGAHYDHLTSSETYLSEDIGMWRKLTSVRVTNITNEQELRRGHGRQENSTYTSSTLLR
jgi:hypothetical protein